MFYVFYSLLLKPETWNLKPASAFETLWICCFDTNVTCNSYKNVRLYLLQMGDWTRTEYHSYYCLFYFLLNGDTKTVWFSWFFLQCDFFLRNFALENRRRAPFPSEELRTKTTSPISFVRVLRTSLQRDSIVNLSRSLPYMYVHAGCK